jgi:hypothetical protein
VLLDRLRGRDITGQVRPVGTQYLGKGLLCGLIEPRSRRSMRGLRTACLSSGCSCLACELGGSR